MSSYIEPIALREAESANDAIPQRVYPTGMWVALGGILMFFAALVSAWVVRKGLSTSELEGRLELPRRLLAVNVCVLAASSGVLEVARRRLGAGDVKRFRRSWYTATALGIVFLAGQFLAWREIAAAGVYVTSNPDASFFYLFTGAHAIHLAGGIVALLLITWRPMRHLTMATATQVAAMYWHFLAAIWMGIFVLLMIASR